MMPGLLLGERLVMGDPVAERGREFGWGEAPGELTDDEVEEMTVAVRVDWVAASWPKDGAEGIGTLPSAPTGLAFGTWGFAPATMCSVVGWTGEGMMGAGSTPGPPYSDLLRGPR